MSHDREPSTTIATRLLWNLTFQMFLECIRLMLSAKEHKPYLTDEVVLSLANVHTTF